MTEQPGSKHIAFGLGLLNLTGLGLGYLYQKRWLRWGIHFALTIGLLAGAFFTNAYRRPLIWLPLLGFWLVWMGFDSWRLGRNLAPEQRLLKFSAGEKQPWLLLAVPGFVLLLIGGALAG